MSERPKEHDWKSCVPRKGTEGSNPSLCAIMPVAPCDGLLLYARISRTPQKPIFGATGRSALCKALPK